MNVSAIPRAIIQILIFQVKTCSRSTCWTRTGRSMPATGCGSPPLHSFIRYDHQVKILKSFIRNFSLLQMYTWMSADIFSERRAKRTFMLTLQLFLYVKLYNYYKNSIPRISIPWLRQKNCTCVEVNSLYLTEAAHPVTAPACNEHRHQMNRLA